MTGYIENPKTRGSGIICCIPQAERCPMECEECFFQSGRSYLEPLGKNLPNMPTLEEVGHRVVRVNDGGDSGIRFHQVIRDTKKYPLKFYNTSIPQVLDEFPAPVVLTVNPGERTDKHFYRVETEENLKKLMFVRARVNTWNGPLVDKIVEWYSAKKIPIVLTFMAYYKQPIPELYQRNYIYRIRTSNPYWAITTETWDLIMRLYAHNKWVHSCGKIEGEEGTTLCRFCGNCLREFYATMERMKGD
ncbi:hypothetical protein E3J38_04240 [candidate division TA06 bacterium]|uniref:Radical SAM protein n=1 Tax=candidate division TA06 bacterium TaxID=2250710 RepID=A0A523XPM2_UNCT6|nr:MAG: hypothetical protein E3J38_04240 [candidate division TA06 bacterium]